LDTGFGQILWKAPLAAMPSIYVQSYYPILLPMIGVIYTTS